MNTSIDFSADGLVILRFMNSYLYKLFLWLNKNHRTFLRLFYVYILLLMLFFSHLRVLIFEIHMIFIYLSTYYCVTVYITKSCLFILLLFFFVVVYKT